MSETLEEKRRANDLYARERAIDLAIKSMPNGATANILNAAKEFADFIINGDNSTKR